MNQQAGTQPSDLWSVTFNAGEGVAATKAALQLMRSVALTFSTNAQVRNLAASLVQNLPPRDDLAEATALFQYVRDNVRFLRDPVTVELIQSVDYMLSQDVPQGDCDDKCTLLASLLLSIGFPVRFVAVGYQKNVFVHVLLQVAVDGQWLYAECSETDPPLDLGEQAQVLPYSLVLDIDTGSFMGAAAPGYKMLPPRGPSPYAGLTVPAFDPNAPNVSLAQWSTFFKNVTGEANARISEGQGTYDTLGEAIDAMLTGAGPWIGFNTEPLPIPYVDMYATNGFFGGKLKKVSATGVTTVTAAPPVATAGGGGGGGGVKGGARPVLKGLGATASVQQVFPVPNPPPGYSGQGEDAGNGYFVLYGNTNGNPAPGMLEWLQYAIRSNGKIVASKAWASGGGIVSWDQAFEPQTRLATQVANMAAVVLSAVGVGEAAAAIDGTAAGAGAGGGTAAAGAGGASTLAPTEVGTVASTSTIAAPVTAVDTGLTASTIAPIATGGATVLGAGGAVADAASTLSGADAAKVAAGLVAAGGAVAVANKQLDVAQANADASKDLAAPVPAPVASAGMSSTEKLVLGVAAALGLWFLFGAA